MAVTDEKVYAPAVLKLLDGTLDLDGETWKALAIASGGTFDPGATEYATLDEIGSGLANECNATNYDRLTLSSVTLALTGGTFPIKFDAADNTITSLGADGTNPIEGWLVYADGASDTERYPLLWLPYATAQSPNGANFTVQWNASGLMTVEQAA